MLYEIMKSWESEPKLGKQILKRRISMPNIYQKLQSIQAQTGQITKAEENKFGKYKYFTEQQALNILKPLLTEQKLTLTFSDYPDQITTEKTEKDWAIRYLKQAILTNSESPEEQLTFHF